MANVEIIKGDKRPGKRGGNGATLDIIRVAPYVRVSTDDEDQIQSYNSQKKYYEELYAGKPDYVLVDIYADEAITGTKTDKREGFRRLITDCLAGRIDLVVTKSISRFARNTLDTLKYVRMLKERRIAVQFEEENINTLTMDGELLLTILSSVAQQEVENTSAHVKKGLKMKMQRGELIGYQGCLGYDYDKATKSISVNEREAETVRYIFMRYISGVGCSVIARELEEMGILTPRGLTHWQDSTVRGIIRNEKYKGDILQGKTFTVDPISKRRIGNMGEEDKFYITEHDEPIISAEDYAKAQAILNRRSIKRIGDTVQRERYSLKYTFSSKLKCAFCGGMLSRRSWNSGTPYQKDIWQCIAASKHGKINCPHSKGIPESIIESAFVEAYNIIAGDNQDVLDEFIKRMGVTLDIEGKQKELAALQSTLRDTIAKRNKLVDLHLSGTIDKVTFEDRLAALYEEEAEINNKIGALERAMEEKQSVTARLKAFRTMLGTHSTLDKFDSMVFNTVVDRVIVGRYNDDNLPDPYHLTYVFRNGDKHIIEAQGLGIKGRGNNNPNKVSTHVETVVLMSRVKE